MISPELVKLLVCPETRASMSPASSALVERINRAIAAGHVKNRAGQPLTRPLDGGLVRSDARVLYPIMDDIPMMLVDEGILLDDGLAP